MNKAGKIKQAFNLSEDELYDTLWVGTLDIVLRAENIGLTPEHEALGFNSAHGPLSRDMYSMLTLEPPSPSSFRFLDDLACARDKLWDDMRPKPHAAAASLEPPWPRRLPIQYLVRPYKVATESAGSHMPFVASRATKTTMISAELALAKPPADDDTKSAIGEMADSYHSALGIYVLQCSPGAEREGRIHAAWSHAVTNLSHRRMSEQEAMRFWRPIFETALPGEKIPSPKDKIFDDYPTITDDIEFDEYTGWDPAVLAPPRIEARRLSTTTLDHMLAASITPWYKGQTFVTLEAETEPLVPASIWSWERLNRISKMPPLVREGMLVSALLYQASKVC